MKFTKGFVEKLAGIIVSVLSCFDRVIFKGHLPFGGDDHLNSWVDYGLKMRRKDFLPWLEQHSQALVDHAKACADEAGRPYQYRQGKFKKELSLMLAFERNAFPGTPTVGVYRLRCGSTRNCYFRRVFSGENRGAVA